MLSIESCAAYYAQFHQATNGRGEDAYFYMIRKINEAIVSTQFHEIESLYFRCSISLELIRGFRLVRDGFVCELDAGWSGFTQRLRYVRCKKIKQLIVHSLKFMNGPTIKLPSL